MELKRDSDPVTPELIERYMCCGECLREIPDGVAPAEWARLNVGFTKQGIQVWCVRHSSNVAHFLLGDMDIEPCQCCGGGLH